MSEKVRIGVVGCGKISPAYFETFRRLDSIEVAACADLDRDRANDRASEFGLPRACTVAELLGDPEIRIVVNLTVPKAHAEINLAAVNAGKSIYCEKPFTIRPEDASAVLTAAKKSGTLVGGAPDTFLGGGAQTCRKLIDDGAIGEPVAATAFMVCHGHESWHPAPAFYYEVGGGPMLDMGPYYLTALVNLLGPIARVAASAKASFPERLITSEPLKGARIPVETPTHITGVMDFVSGATATVIMSFDVWSANLPTLEVYGTEGSLAVPDPNGFGGPVALRRADDAEWRDIPLTHPADLGRGLGVADVARALTTGQPHRANGQLVYHVLEVMQAFDKSSTTGRHVEIESRCDRPAPMPAEESRE